jgi:cellobiose epimerase
MENRARIPANPLAADARRELEENILPFWRRHAVDELHGGFIAQMSNELRRETEARKGLILNARILWTFSAAYRHAGLPEDQALAQRAYDYLIRYFHDPQYGGYFWELDAQGRRADEVKKTYGQAFCLYALAEYCQVFSDSQARQQAIELFELLESHSRDAQFGGYWEVRSRDWQPVEDMRLSDKDLNEKKSMNNHLHVLEAYANLLRVWPDPLLARRLRDLIDIFPQHILNAERIHCRHFFDESWAPKSTSYTFGHDIEASWLLCEAADVLQHPTPTNLSPAGIEPTLGLDIRALAVNIARAMMREGLDDDGGLFYEADAGQITNTDKEWWPQAEAVVGFLNAWQLSGDPAFRDAALHTWQFIQNRIVDPVHGEWFWRVAKDGSPDLSMPKLSAWKCPYHNSRCCLEIIRRLQPPSELPSPNQVRT